MSKISVVIITYNEAEYIGNCIRSVAEVADEIVVVDSFSTDKTKEICLSNGVRFVEHEFEGYRDQKNFALSLASNDYVLSLDADEELSPKLEKSILDVKNDLKYDGYKFNRLNSFCGTWINHTSLSPECKVRLFNRKKGRWGGLNIHEVVVLDNPKKIKRLSGDLIHWLYNNYEESIQKMNRYTTLLASEYFRIGIKATPKRLLLNPLWRFIHSYFLKAGFLDGYSGFVVSRFLSITCFTKYVKLKNLYRIARAKQKEPAYLSNKLCSAEKFEPLSIGYDAKRAFYNQSGLGNYSRNLLHALAKNNPDNSYYLFTPKIKDRFVIEDEDKFNLVLPEKGIPQMLSSLWRLSFMNNNIKNKKLNVFHGLSQELPVGIKKTGVRTVVTVHDLIFLRFPEFYNIIDAKIYNLKLVHACRVSDHIVAISQQTKNDLIRFLNIPSDKISVIHQGCNALFWKSQTKEFLEQVRLKYNLPGRYLLNIGTIEERKNLMGIIKAIHLKKIDIPLVVIGRKMDGYYEKVMDYIKSNNIQNVFFPERVLTEELPAIYQNAECFIYPSFYEGFGIPLLEALVSRTPVITSKRGCFTEAAGPGSLYVEPHDPEEIGDAILKVLVNREERDKMIEAGIEHARNFTDEVIARKYMRLYCSLQKTGN